MAEGADKDEHAGIKVDAPVFVAENHQFLKTVLRLVHPTARELPKEVVDAHRG